jgi:hypothetical protein
MFYIVETNEQLNELFEKGYDRVFIELILHNDKVHPSLNHLSLLYIKPLNNDKGYILSLDHTEALSLNKTSINQLLNSFKEIYLRDRKTFIYFFPVKNTIDISFYTPEYTEPSTPAHDFFYTRHNDKLNINTFIPLVKHYEKCEFIFEKVKQYCIERDNSKFYNKLTSVFFAIERNGIKINEDVFYKFFETNNDKFSIQNSRIYTQYNPYTTTGRPSNSFNSINFAALAKDNGCRKAFIPNNNYFIEIDINAYHPTLAAQLIKYDFGDESPYQYFAREAGIELNEAKTLMFRQLYGGIYKEYTHIDYFQLIQEHTNKIWKEFTDKGYIECPISGHKLTNELKDLNPQKLFNYTLQNLETSTNVCIVWDIIKLLKNKSTKIVLYTYDSILLDYDEDDEILEDIKNIFKKHNLKIKLTKGKNYGTMVPL